MQTTDIEQLRELLADESQFPARMGFRNASSPSWIFFDDDRELTEDERYFRELTLDFEEWNAARNHWNEEETDPRFDDYVERQASRSAANWIVAFHKKRPKDNDRFHRILSILTDKFLDADEQDDASALLKLKGLRKVFMEKSKYAPGPVAGTTFVNPDGTKHRTTGVAPGSAKASFIKRHNITEEFVSIDRVQMENERTSRYVVGVRRSSEDTPSNYYDPNPSWREVKRNGEWVKDYNPCGNTLYIIPESKVFNGHRLTVRQFEQSLIAGSETMEDELDALANSFEHGDGCPDSRILLLELGYGSDGRDELALTEQERYLARLLRAHGHEVACDLIALRDQQPGLIHNYFFNKDNDHAKDGEEDDVNNMLLQVLNDDNWTTRKAFQRVGPGKGEIVEKAVPPVNEEPMYPFIWDVLMNCPLPERQLNSRLTTHDKAALIRADFTPGEYAFTKLG